MNQFQQGDVNIERCVVPKDAKPRADRIVARGEVTNHYHVVEGEVEMLELGDRIFARVLGGDCRVIHQEHGPITLPPGEYEFRRTLEVDHFVDQARYVAD